jgi:hypothetical protein
MIGDVFHQLRATLDHLVYALATRGCQTPKHDELKNLEFLIRKSSRDFDCDWRVTGDFFARLIGPSELTQMKASQPYNRNSIAPTADPMWIVRELDNIDKHRTVVVMKQRTAMHLRASSQDEIHTHDFNVITAAEPTKPDAQVFDIGWPHPPPPATVEMKHATSHIVFTETGGLCDGIEVFPLMRQSITVVNDTLDNFSTFLP